MNKYKGSLEGCDLDLFIKKDSIRMIREDKVLQVFRTEERNMVVQINTTDLDESGKYKECLNFFIPESVCSVFEAMFCR